MIWHFGGVWRRGEFDWRGFWGGWGLVAQVFAVFFGAGRRIHAGGRVPRHYSGVGAAVGRPRVPLCPDRLFPRTSIRAHDRASFSFWGRDTSRRSEPRARADDGAARAGDPHLF